MWSLIAFPLAFAAYVYVGYQSRLRVRGRLKSLSVAIGSGAALGLAATVVMQLVQSYEYFMAELLTAGTSVRLSAVGALIGAWLAAAGWKARGDVERRQRRI